MVMTIANIIRLPLLLFTNVENMPILVITPSLSIAETPLPLYLVYNATGPGHYDYAVPEESLQEQRLPCHETCRCESCSNTHGQKPKPSTRRRKAYDNHRQQLRGISGVQFMVSMNEQVSAGSMSSLEVIVIQTIIIFTILNGVDITAEHIFSAYNILSVSKPCSTVDMPLYVRSLRFIKLIS